MSDENNPNPRGYTLDGTQFIDLGRVDAVFRPAGAGGNITTVWLGERTEPVRVSFSDEAHRSFIKALMFYRSQR